MSLASQIELGFEAVAAKFNDHEINAEREIARRVQTGAEAGQAAFTAITDIMGCQITFYVPQYMIDDGYFCEVMGMQRWLYCTVGPLSGVLTIADETNTEKGSSLFSTASAGQYSTAPVAYESIYTAGWYFRKLRANRASGTGSINVGVNTAANTGAFIHARMVKL